MPGITANFDEPYVKDICQFFVRNNFKTVIYNDRRVSP